MVKYKNELEKHKSIWVTKEAYRILRAMKPIEGKSMMRIVDDLIQKYGNETLCKVFNKQLDAETEERVRRKDQYPGDMG